MDHDQLFKRLLRTFFREFLEAFVPELHDQLCPGSIEFLDKELFDPAEKRKSSRRIVDLVAKVRLRDQGGFILIHTENQAQPQKDLVWRMLCYAVWLMDQYRLPVYPILVCSYDRPLKEQSECYRMDAAGLGVIQFRFRVVQLNRMDWRSFVRSPNPVATALMTRMQIRPEDRVQVKVQILRLLTQMRLDLKKMELIAGFADQYLVLDRKEELAFRGEIAKIKESRERRRAMRLMTQWEREGLQRGRKEGRIEGERAAVFRLVKRRFGRMPNGLSAQIRQLNSRKVEALIEAFLDFSTVADLKCWLQQANHRRG